MQMQSISKIMTKRVAYVYDSELASFTDKIPNIKGRAKLVHNLILAYQLTNHMNWIRPEPATVQDLKVFHSSAYVDFLTTLNKQSEGRESEVDEEPLLDSSEDEDIDFDSLNFENEHNLTHEDFGFNFDSPLFKDIGKFACVIAGGTLTACRALLCGWKLAINWCGGWHHAKRDEARGFCTVNDTVLACHLLQKKFPKILYIDLDAHHGDGVEEAFSSTQSVLTFSIHIREPGFYPGTGFIEDVGVGSGKYFTVNAPLMNSVSDEQFCTVFNEILSCIEGVFPANAVIVQCGTDFLNDDPLGNGNLTERGLGDCVSRILKLNLPTLFLGGGGYHKINAAKCWTYLTSIITEVPICTDIPENDNFLLYGPDFVLSVSASPRKSANTPEYLQSVVSQIKENLQNISPNSGHVTTPCDLLQ